jgi:large subunit ribosomal protein L24
VKLKIRRGALVEITAGSDKGKRGSVLEVNPKTLKIKVQGVKIMTHHDRKEGLLKQEGFFDYSNVKLIENAKPSEKKSAKKAKTASKK